MSISNGIGLFHLVLLHLLILTLFTLTMNWISYQDGAVFAIIDYIICALVFAISLCIGVFYTFTNKTPEDYFVGNRKLRVLPVALSIVGSYTSTATVLGSPAEMFYYGSDYWMFIVGSDIGYFVACFVFIPLIHPLKITTINQYLFLRYGQRWIRQLFSVVLVIIAITVGGIVAYGPATMMQQFAGIPIWISLIVITQIAAIYTAIGGYKAVIWTDVMQTVGLLLGLLILFVTGCVRVGSLTEVFQIYNEHRGSMNFEVSLTVRSSVWCYLVGMAIKEFAVMSVGQAAVQRYSSLPTVSAAKRSLLITIPIVTIIFGLCSLLGMVSFAYYTKLGCDPLRGKLIGNTNQIIPYFIKDVLLYPTIPGIFAGCILCTTISSLSSLYNNCAALLWNDIFDELLEDYNLSESRKSLIGKFISVTSGLLITAFGFAVAQMGGTLMQMMIVITGVFFSPLFSMAFLGAVSQRTSFKGAFVASVVGSVVVTYLSVGGLLYGSNTVPLPTVTSTCQHFNTLLKTAGNYSQFDWINSSVYEVTAVTEFTTNLPSTNASQIRFTATETAYVYRISHVWYFPISVIVAIALGLVFTRIPGMAANDDVNPLLIIPFLRPKLHDHEFQLYHAKTDGDVVRTVTDTPKL